MSNTIRLPHWLTLIAVLVGLGCLQVAQRNALFLSGYAAGDRVSKLHAKEIEVGWLNAQVTGHLSPVALDQAAQERRLNLVAWSTWRSEPPGMSAETSPASANSPASSEAASSRSVGRLAAVEPAQSTDNGDTSD